MQLSRAGRRGVSLANDREVGPRRSFGRTACYASGDPVEFARVAELFLRRDMTNTVFKTAVL